MHGANVCMGDCSNSNPVLNNVTALRGAKFIHRIKISVLWFGENILEGHEKQLAVPAKEVREISLLALSGSYNLSAPILGSFGALVFYFLFFHPLASVGLGGFAQAGLEVDAFRG